MFYRFYRLLRYTFVLPSLLVFSGAFAQTDFRPLVAVLASTDPDGDRLTFKWWIMPEAGTYEGPASVDNADSAEAVLRLPDDAEGEIHLICEVEDDGTIPLTSYRRIVVTVRR